jgi:deoxyadenosine/deoxycytidine kinase
MLYEDGLLSSIEWETYNYWFNTFKETSKVNLIIYIKTNPDKCLERINKRNRIEENSIKLDYLVKCDKYHNDWLNNNNNIIMIDGHNTIDIIRDTVLNILNEI